MHTKPESTKKTVCLHKDYPKGLTTRIENSKADPKTFLVEASKAVGFTLIPDDSINYDQLYETVKKHVTFLLKESVKVTAKFEPFASQQHLIGGMEFMIYWCQVYEQLVDSIVKGYKKDDEFSKRIFSTLEKDLKNIPCCFYAKHVVVVGMNAMASVIQAGLDYPDLNQYLKGMDGIDALIYVFNLSLAPLEAHMNKIKQATIENMKKTCLFCTKGFKQDIKDDGKLFVRMSMERAR